jgi:glutaminyl-peptide cyclotransferase
MGPRTPGSAGHAQIREWMRVELESAGWMVEVHESERMGNPIYNIIAKRSDEAPEIILGAHYDTRFFADNDPDENKRSEPVPGANDGASGVAVLLELARTLPKDTEPIWLVFFDTEDNGRIEGWDWILGSRAFVEEIPVQPKAVVIVDMIGDADLNIYLEKTPIMSSVQRYGRLPRNLAMEMFLSTKKNSAYWTTTHLSWKQAFPPSTLSISTIPTGTPHKTQ